MRNILTYLKQALWIAYFWLLGEGIAFMLVGVVPGSVIGMILLYATLELGWLKPAAVEGVSRGLMKYMTLFFVPPAIGIVASWERVAPQAAAIITAMGVSTVAVLVTVALIQEYLEKRNRKPPLEVEDRPDDLHDER